jgi:hypothetical protein
MKAAEPPRSATPPLLQPFLVTELIGSAAI